jgi:hypothetical protein
MANNLCARRNLFLGRYIRRTSREVRRILESSETPKGLKAPGCEERML